MTLSVAGAGLNYQWKKGNTTIPGEIFQAYIANKTGAYKCVVSNNCGVVTSNAIKVVVNPLPTVSVSQDPCSGATILLHAIANPATGVTYQWRKGTKIIPGATNAIYNATTSGTYKCMVTITANGCSTTSAATAVNINCLFTTINSKDKNGTLVYPNPGSDYFIINAIQLDPHSMIYIYDLAGKLCETHSANATEMHVGRSLAQGVYVMKIVVNNETKQVIKLMKIFQQQ